MTAVRRRAAWVCATLLLCLPAGAQAAAGLEVGMEDERLLLGSPEVAPSVVAAWERAGIDVVRIHARWSEIAPGRNQKRRPQGFHASDHQDRLYTWDALDKAIALVRAHGMRIALTVTGPGPLWSSRAPARRNARYKPDARAFGAFARAVASRYGGDVDRYLIWNEPNQPGWLEPQLACSGTGARRRCAPMAPHIYRDLLAAAVTAIKAADPGAEVVAGELAPIGRELTSARVPIAPLTFLRSMACVTESYKRMPRTGSCARFKPVYADSIGHHPHGVLQAPDEISTQRTWAKIADLGRLLKVLDRLTAMRRMVAPDATRGRFVLHLTEFGYQTSPPDHVIGVTLDQQARYLQQAAYIAWSNPRVRSLVHYQWEDEPVRYRAPGALAYAGWQSGLHFVNGDPKPALQGFQAPFVVDVSPSGTRARFWGQVRAGGINHVTIQRRSGAGSFVRFIDLETDADGYFVRELTMSGDEDDYRFTWTAPPATPDAQPQARRSGVVELSARGGKRVRAASASTAP